MQLSRRQFIGLVGALGLGGCAQTRQRIGLGSAKRLTFAAINDVHVLDARSAAIVHRAVQSINANADVAFTVILGDIATAGRLPELKLALASFNRLERPWLAVPGNHDVCTAATNIYSNYLITFERMNWMEEEKGWVFIGIDSCEGAKSDVTVRDWQIDWLADSLERIRRDRPIALFAHHPFNPHSKAYRVQNADEVIGLFAHHNLRLVAAGHYHGNQVEQQDGVLYTTTACCSTTRDNFDNTAAKGYRLFHIEGEGVTTEFVEVPS
ncbi:MAG: metallophosphoesterase [Candidatus Hydrogenedentes bacterium]|nr:metallophosphoesterase [Candidatus Hydrogenedentota bacterium]